jgi:hypothetical protein
MVVTAIVVEIFHLSRVQNGLFYAVLRAEPVIDDRTGSQVSKLGLNHPPPVSRCDMGVVYDLKEFAVVQDRVPAAELCCLDH